MIPSRTCSGYRTAKRGSRDPRLIIILVIGVMAWLAVIIRLFSIQVLQREWYSALAAGQRELFQKLYPERGEVFVRDRRRPDGYFPIATNKQLFTLYAVPTEVREPKRTAKKLAPLTGVDEKVLVERLSKTGDPYEPLKRFVEAAERDAVLALKLPGIAAEAVLTRYYPDGVYAAHLTGFVGEDEQGISGRYGLEGAFDKVLAGTVGFLAAERDPGGHWIVFGKREESQSENGSSLFLTIEREVQVETCRRLEKAVKDYGAAGGTVMILQPATGAVRALCGAPSFDPNHYAETANLASFNSLALVGAYEPGSVFKPITMAAAIDSGVVTSATQFIDTGSVVVGGRTITNTDSRVYHESTMADVLRYSINTGAVFAARTLGINGFRTAVEKFGFGALTDIEISGEAPGDINSLTQPEEIYLATASYGQGISVTPLQLAAAYAALVNGGKLMQPYLVEEVVGADGTRRRTEPHTVRQVISSRTSTLLQGMLVSVVKDGYPKRAGVPGYLIGGKTGTAQIPFSDRPGYSNETIHTFAGFGPAEQPTFVMVVRLDRPQTKRFADSTAAPLFSDIAKFLLQYDGIAPRE